MPLEAWDREARKAANSALCEAATDNRSGERERRREGEKDNASERERGLVIPPMLHVV